MTAEWLLKLYIWQIRPIKFYNSPKQNFWLCPGEDRCKDSGRMGARVYVLLRLCPKITQNVDFQNFVLLEENFL